MSIGLIERTPLYQTIFPCGVWVVLPHVDGHPYRPESSHLMKRILKLPSALHFIQLNALVIHVYAAKRLFGHRAIWTRGLWIDDYTILGDCLLQDDKTQRFMYNNIFLLTSYKITRYLANIHPVDRLFGQGLMYNAHGTDLLNLQKDAGKSALNGLDFCVNSDFLRIKQKLFI